MCTRCLAAATLHWTKIAYERSCHVSISTLNNLIQPLHYSETYTLWLTQYIVRYINHLHYPVYSHDINTVIVACLSKANQRVFVQRIGPSLARTITALVMILVAVVAYITSITVILDDPFMWVLISINTAWAAFLHEFYALYFGWRIHCFNLTGQAALEFARVSL